MPDQTLAPIDVARQVYRDVRQYPRIKKNPALSPLAAGSDSNVLLPTGETYRSLIFRARIAGVAATEAECVAQINKLQLIVDGDTKIDIDAGDAMMLQNYYQKRAGVAQFLTGCFRLDFVRPWHREIGGEDGPAWGTSDVRSLELVVGLAGGATIDSIDTFRVVTDPEPMGRHLCIRRKPRNTAAAGVDRVDQWKRDIGTSLMAIHVEKTTITDVLLEIDNVKEIDCPTIVLNHQAQQYERTPQTAAGYTHIDFAMRNRLKDAVPMIAQTMNLDLTWSAAPNAHTLLLEQIEGPAA